MKRTVNFPLAALIITSVGALGTFAIINVAETADHEAYGSSHAQQKSGEVPTISEELEEPESPRN